MGMETGEDDAMIVRSTIDLAHNLGLTVVAEGVETAAIQDRLRALACGDVQRQSFSPMLAILSARHEAQYSRLFRS